MKSVSVIIFCVVTALAQATSFSTLVTLSLTMASLNTPVHGFFGFFRRRSPVPTIIEEESSAPQGPVKFPASGFPQRAGFFGGNPFAAGGNRFVPGFTNFPGFPGLFQGGFQAQQPSSSWFSSQNMPIQQQSAQFQSQQQSAQFHPQSQFQPQTSGQSFQGFDQVSAAMQSESNSGFDRDVRFDDQPHINTEEAESFFTLLAETDENKCISRLVCEMGADPESAGDLGTTISEIIGSLTDFPDGSKVSEYNQILQGGRTQGLQSCTSRYSTCDEESYKLMKDSQAEDTEKME